MAELVLGPVSWNFMASASVFVIVCHFLLVLTNTLDFYFIELKTAIKIFMTQAPGLKHSFAKKQ
jgi:hypothetical protein